MINSDNSHLAQQVHTPLTLMVGVPARAVSRNRFVWLNLVCLDAPLVTISWQWIFGNALHLVVPLGHRLALFFTAWLIYLATGLAIQCRFGRASQNHFGNSFVCVTATFGLEALSAWG
jgi:hypothetical protein